MESCPICPVWPVFFAGFFTSMLMMYLLYDFVIDNRRKKSDNKIRETRLTRLTRLTTLKLTVQCKRCGKNTIKFHTGKNMEYKVESSYYLQCSECLWPDSVITRVEMVETVEAVEAVQ